MSLKKGMEVTVLNANEWGHSFPIGAKLTVVDDEMHHFTCEGFGYTQSLHPSEYEVISQPKQETQAVSKETIIDKDATKLLYVVVRQSDNRVIHSTHDRDFAREVKAEFGGKKAGYVIITHKAVQEIR